MTGMREHIEDLAVTDWAALTRSAAVESIEASRRMGLQPRPETVALAAMTEAKLAEHRERNGPGTKRASPVMQLVEADHRSRAAESRARDAHQGRLDADATAALARSAADEAARTTTAARERLRAVEAQSADKDRQRAQERTADQQAVQLAKVETERVRGEAAAAIEQARADAAAEVAAALERASAAEARAEQRATERTAERSVGEKAIQQLHVQLDQVRADAAAEVAAAQERARAAEARAEQRVTERAAERAAGEEAVAQLRGESERARADAAAELAAIRGKAVGEVTAARHAAEADVTAVRQAAQAEVAAVRQAADADVAAARQAAEAEVAAAHQAARVEVENARRSAQAEIDGARKYADDAARQAQAELARVSATAVATRLLTIPIAPVQVRGHIRRIEEVLDALYQIDYVLEIGMTVQPAPDVTFVRSLAATVQERVKGLSDEFANLPSKIGDPAHAEAATAYANAAGAAYHALLQRIEGAVPRVGDRSSWPAAGIIDAVSAMLADPWIQALR